MNTSSEARAALINAYSKLSVVYHDRIKPHKYHDLLTDNTEHNVALTCEQIEALIAAAYAVLQTYDQ